MFFEVNSVNSGLPPISSISLGKLNILITHLGTMSLLVALPRPQQKRHSLKRGLMWEGSI